MVYVNKFCLRNNCNETKTKPYIAKDKIRKPKKGERNIGSYIRKYRDTFINKKKTRVDYTNANIKKHYFKF